MFALLHTYLQSILETWHMGRFTTIALHQTMSVLSVSSTELTIGNRRVHAVCVGITLINSTTSAGDPAWQTSTTALPEHWFVERC